MARTSDGSSRTEEEDDLASAIGRLNISSSSGSALTGGIVEVVKSSAKVDLLNNAAVKYIHGDIEGDVYLEKIIQLSRNSREAIAAGDSEIPAEWSQGDLYREYYLRGSNAPWLKHY